ncbi:hypothetical protein D3C87_655870 [compost metagenome]
MAAPTEDFINQAQDEVLTIFKARKDFMSPKAKDAPPGARGPIRLIEDDLPETDRIGDREVPHCSIVYLDDGPVPEDSASSDTDYQVTIGLRLYAKGADRRKTWRSLKKAGAIAAKIVAYEMSPYGSNFNGFATLARYEGGTAIDTKEDSGFGAMLLSRITVQLSLPDYQDGGDDDDAPPDEDDEETP